MNLSKHEADMKIMDKINSNKAYYDYMLLFLKILFIGEKMQEFCGEQTVPPTEKAAKYVLIIKVLIALQLVVAILDIVANDSFLR